MIGARFLFRGLLIVVGIGMASLGVSAQACLQSSDCHQLKDAVDKVALELRLAWRHAGTVGLDDAQRLRFPPVDIKPGLYRFEMRDGDEVTLYVGESENLHRRLLQYRSPGRKEGTNHRVCVELRRTLLSGGSVTLSIVTEDAWLCPQTGCVRATLESANQRKLMEQLAIFSIAPGVLVMNREKVVPRVAKSAAVRRFYVCS